MFEFDDDYYIEEDKIDSDISTNTEDKSLVPGTSPKLVKPDETGSLDVDVNIGGVLVLQNSAPPRKIEDDDDCKSGCEIDSGREKGTEDEENLLEMRRYFSLRFPGTTEPTTTSCITCTHE